MRYGLLAHILRCSTPRFAADPRVHQLIPRRGRHRVEPNTRSAHASADIRTNRRMNWRWRHP
jgi:hypothetical protein